jgi:Mn-dependent DtxR family transcriptional regulator
LRITAKTFGETDAKTFTRANVERGRRIKRRLTRRNRRLEDNPIGLETEAAELADEWEKVMSPAFVAAVELLLLLL